MCSQITEPREALINILVHKTATYITANNLSIFDYLWEKAMIIIDKDKPECIYTGSRGTIVIMAEKNEDTALSALARIILCHHIDYPSSDQLTKKIFSLEVDMFKNLFQLRLDGQEEPIIKVSQTPLLLTYP